MLYTPVRASLASSCYSLVAKEHGIVGGSGTAVGLVNMAFAGSSAVAPVVGGALVHLGSLRTSFGMVMIAAGSGGAAVLLIARHAREARFGGPQPETAGCPH
jgi:MFS family permease